FLLAYLGYSCATVVNYALLIDVSDAADRDPVSSFGWALSYIGGGALLAGDFVLSLFLSDKAWLARISLCTAGLWWALFNVLPWRMLLGLPRPSDRDPDGRPASDLLAGFRQLRRTLAELRNYPITLAFLI